MVSFLIIHFEGMAPRPLKKVFLHCRILNISKGQKKKIHNYKFSRVDALRKGKFKGPIIRKKPV